MSNAHKGKVFSAEHKQKISESLKGRKTPEEVMAKRRMNYIIDNKNSDVVIETNNLKQWCIDNDQIYQSLWRTSKTGYYTRKGYRATMNNNRLD